VVDDPAAAVSGSVTPGLRNAAVLRGVSSVAAVCGSSVVGADGGFPLCDAGLHSGLFCMGFGRDMLGLEQV